MGNAEGLYRVIYRLIIGFKNYDVLMENEQEHEMDTCIYGDV